jgi:hypothetical protein
VIGCQIFGLFVARKAPEDQIVAISRTAERINITVWFVQEVPVRISNKHSPVCWDSMCSRLTNKTSIATKHLHVVFQVPPLELTRQTFQIVSDAISPEKNASLSLLITARAAIFRRKITYNKWSGTHLERRHVGDGPMGLDRLKLIQTPVEFLHRLHRHFHVSFI